MSSRLLAFPLISQRERKPSSDEMAFAEKKVILKIGIWKKCLDKAREFRIKRLVEWSDH